MRVSFEDLIQIDFEDGLRYLLGVLKVLAKTTIKWTILYFAEIIVFLFNLLRPAEDLLLLNIFDFGQDRPSGTFYRIS